MSFIVRKIDILPRIFLRSCNTIARAENLQIKPVSDYKMGYLLLALGKVFGGAGTFLPKKVPANRLPAKSKFEIPKSLFLGKGFSFPRKYVKIELRKNFSDFSKKHPTFSHSLLSSRRALMRQAV